MDEKIKKVIETQLPGWKIVDDLPMPPARPDIPPGLSVEQLKQRNKEKLTPGIVQADEDEVRFVRQPNGKMVIMQGDKLIGYQG